MAIQVDILMKENDRVKERFPSAVMRKAIIRGENAVVWSDESRKVAQLIEGKGFKFS